MSGQAKKSQKILLFSSPHFSQEIVTRKHSGQAKFQKTFGTGKVSLYLNSLISHSTPAGLKIATKTPKTWISSSMN